MNEEVTLPFRNSILVSGWEATHCKKTRGQGEKYLVPAFFHFLYDVSQKMIIKQKDDTKSIIFMAGPFPKQLISELKI
jgi:hypothetical protein